MGKRETPVRLGLSGTWPKISSRCLHQSSWSVLPRNGPSWTTLCASDRSTISQDSPINAASGGSGGLSEM